MIKKHRRHRNGGGLVEDLVEVARSVRVETPAKISDGAEITGTGLICGASHVCNEALVADSPRIVDTTVAQYAIVTGNPYLYRSLINSHAIITGEPTITQSQVGGTARVNDKAQVNRSIVEGNALVGRDAIVQESVLMGNTAVLGGQIHGVKLTRSQRVHEGVWYRAPRYTESPVAALSMTECVNGKVIIGCLCRSVSWWKANAEKMQEEYGWGNLAVQWVRDNIDRLVEPIEGEK